jgi:hypothetical protein
VQNVLIAIKHYRMTRVVTTRVAGYDISAFRQKVDDLSFSLISPLHSYNNSY